MHVILVLLGYTKVHSSFFVSLETLMLIKITGPPFVYSLKPT